jgi:putative MATE family efflux protein
MRHSQEVDMIHGPLGSKIIHMAIPLALTGIIQQLFNSADIAMIGQFVGKDAMAAVGSNAPILTTLVSLFVGVSLGTNVVIASFIGQHHEEKVSAAVHTSIVTSFLCGIIIMILGELATVPMLNWLGVPPEIMDMAVLYLRVLFLSMPFDMLYNFQSSIFRAIGDTRTPLMALVLAGVIKVTFNLVALLVFKSGVAGVAVGSIISFMISSGILLHVLRHTDSIIHVETSKLRIDMPVLRRMLVIGVPAGIQGMVFSLSNLCIQSAINSLGAEIMATSAAAYNIEILVYFICFSLAQVDTTVFGQNYGAGFIDRCRMATRLCFGESMLISFSLAFLSVFFAEDLLSIFTSDPTVIHYGAIRLTYVTGFEFLNSMLDIFAGSMRGFGNSLIPALVTLVCVCGSRITWVYTVFPIYPSLQVLMYCYPISWALTSIFLAAAYFYYVHTLEELQKK